MKIGAVIFADDNTLPWRTKAMNSFKFFHPDIPLFHYSNNERQSIIDKYNLNGIPDGVFGGVGKFIGPLILKEVWERERLDLIIKIGNDTLTLGRFNEIFEKEYDVAAGRNDPDSVGSADERHNRPDIIRDIPNDEWVNADLIAIKNKKFLDEYAELVLNYALGRDLCLANQPYYDEYGRLLFRIYDGDCQSALNVVFRTRGFSSLILDKNGSGVIYNASGNWTGEKDNHRPQCLGGGPNNWKSWKYIHFNGENFIMPDLGAGCGDRIVKCLHHGGGGCKNKLSWEFFNEKTLTLLKRITGAEK